MEGDKRVAARKVGSDFTDFRLYTVTKEESRRILKHCSRSSLESNLRCQSWCCDQWRRRMSGPSRTIRGKHWWRFTLSPYKNGTSERVIDKFKNLDLSVWITTWPLYNSPATITMSSSTILMITTVPTTVLLRMVTVGGPWSHKSLIVSDCCGCRLWCLEHYRKLRGISEKNRPLGTLCHDLGPT